MTRAELTTSNPVLLATIDHLVSRDGIPFQLLCKVVYSNVNGIDLSRPLTESQLALGMLYNSNTEVADLELVGIDFGEPESEDIAVCAINKVFELLKDKPPVAKETSVKPELRKEVERFLSEVSTPDCMLAIMSFVPSSMAVYSSITEEDTLSAEELCLLFLTASLGCSDQSRDFVRNQAAANNSTGIAMDPAFYQLREMCRVFDSLTFNVKKLRVAALSLLAMQQANLI